MGDRPEPLVPAEVDLRDFGFMPLHVQRLRDSELVDFSTGNEFKAAVLLWAFSWHQQPAGSLPNDDRILAARSGADAAWRKVKTMALRGFVECSDGRLYHPLIAEAALDAWERREDFREVQDNKETRQERWRRKVKEVSEQIRALGFTPPRNVGLEALEKALRDAQASQRETVRDGAETSQRDAAEMALTGTGTGTGTEIRQEKEPPPIVGTVAMRETDPPPDISPTAAGLICRALKRAGIGSVNPGHATLQVLIAAGATEAEFLGAVDAARDKGDPFAYLLGVVEGQRKRAAESAKGLHQGAMPAAMGGDRKARQLATAALMTGAGRQPASTQPTEEVFDVAVRFIAP